MSSGRRYQCLSPASRAGFTLLEIMVAIFIFAVMITTVFGSFRVVFSSTDAVSGDVAIFQSARVCMERMAADLTALTISHYPRYTKPEFNDPLDHYRLVGDATVVAASSFGRLQFASLEHLPLNQEPRPRICRIVYYVHQRADRSLVLRRADHGFPFPDFEESEQDPILCENILALEFEYRNAEGQMSDRWDSESSETDYSTPRSVEIRLTVGSASRPMSFTTRVPLHVYRQAAE